MKLIERRKAELSAWPGELKSPVAYELPDPPILTAHMATGINLIPAKNHKLGR